MKKNKHALDPKLNSFTSRTKVENKNTCVKTKSPKSSVTKEKRKTSAFIELVLAHLEKVNRPVSICDIIKHLRIGSNLKRVDSYYQKLIEKESEQKESRLLKVGDQYKLRGKLYPQVISKRSFELGLIKNSNIKHLSTLSKRTRRKLSPRIRYFIYYFFLLTAIIVMTRLVLWQYLSLMSSICVGADICAFLFMYNDKMASLSKRERTPETVLLTSNFLGSYGGFFGMFCIRHKTQKVHFYPSHIFALIRS
ncbi:hypothetical protein AKO1_008040, partial [Acrasis kona]